MPQKKKCAEERYRHVMLGWHYRSRYETLISYSNHAFYEGGLLTIPDRTLHHSDRQVIESAQAEEAIRKFNNQLFMGRPLAVNEAREREDRPQSSPSRSYAPDREFPEAPGSTERPAGRSFGPDAAPRRTFRKPGGKGGKGERAPKQPIRERPGGRFFGEDADESTEDDLSSDNFASRVDDELEGDDSANRVENSDNK